ncbi:MAG: HEPN domain-containing protein [Verrucomicrobia bacterium]|nr:HEPN domain-containing protein [Verrucomicrobiota bacterium]MCH8528385.1 HEPN domain-containing protein [Kiritimatiellia bacterium]
MNDQQKQYDEQDPQFRMKRNSFIEYSFRDTADQDYIAARTLYRNQLLGPFLWSSLQAIEKYLKAILLYNERPAKTGHNTIKALNEVKKIGEIGFICSTEIEDFLEYLDEQGPNRYLSYTRYSKGDELSLLDESVFMIRRFCDDYFFPHESSKKRQHDQYLLKAAKSQDILKNRHKFRLAPKGYLGKVLDDPKLKQQRDQLIYQNLFYGAITRNKVKRRPIAGWSRSGNLMFPEIKTWVDERVHMSKEEIRLVEFILKHE